MTALSLFDAEGVDLDQRLRQNATLEQSDGARHPQLWDGAYRQLGQLARGFLVTDLASIVLFGLGKTSELLSAAQRTADNEDCETVELNGKRVVLDQHPRIDLMLAGKVVRTVVFTLSVDVDIVALAASVRHAQIVELTSGTANVHVSFSADGVLIGEARRTFDPHLAINLGPGWDLQEHNRARG
jgi:hypothetical protein